MEDSILDDGLGRVEPEVVILGNQTEEEVKTLLEKEKVKEDIIRGGRRFDFKHDTAKAAADVQDCKEFINKAAKIKLAFEDAPKVEGGFPDLGKFDRKTITKDLNLFHTWRRLADVGESCKDGEPCLPDDLSPIQELMELILIKIKMKFKKLDLSWSKGWQPHLLINDCPTQITMNNLSFAHNGLSHLVDEATAQQIISDIVVKKLQTLFI